MTYFPTSCGYLKPNSNSLKEKIDNGDNFYKSKDLYFMNYRQC